MKNGKAFAQVLLYLRTKLKKRDRSDINSFFRNEVVTYDRLRKVSVKQVGLLYLDTPPEEDMLDVHRNNEPVTITYRDRKGAKTSKMIEPLKIETDPCSGVRRIESYCYLRDAKRTFLSKGWSTPSRRIPNSS